MFLTRRIITGGGDVFRDEFSLAFDGTNDYIAIAGKPVDTADATYVFWYKSTVSGVSNRAIFAHGDDKIGEFSISYDSQNRALLYLHSNLYIYFDDGAGNTHVGDGQWHHAALVVDIDDMDGCKLYIDTIEIPRATKVESGTATAYGNMEIGRADSTKEFEGSLSDFAVYDKHLSISEVKTLYNGREPYNHKEGVCLSNLQAWWRMGDGVLDDRNGLVADQTNATLTSNVVVNGKFDTDSDWTKGTGWSINNGEAIFTGTDFANLTPASSPLESGKNYKITLDATVTNGSFKLQHNSVDIITGNTTGSFTAYFTSSNTTFNIARASVGVQNDFTVDNIVIKKINGKSGIMTNMDTNDFEGDTP